MQTLQVIFKKLQGEVVAIFPFEQWNGSTLVSYMHNGQHSGFDAHLAYQCPNATKEEYAPLLAELKSIYNDIELEVLNRMPPMQKVLNTLLQATFGMTLKQN